MKLGTTVPDFSYGGFRVGTLLTDRKEEQMELEVQQPEEEKIDFAVLYGGKIAM